MTRIPAANRRVASARQDGLADIEELLAEMLGPPPPSIRDARVMLGLIRRQFALVISLATRDQRALLTLDESEMVMDLLAERAGDRAPVRAPARTRTDGSPLRAITVKEARGTITRVALQLGQDPNSFWLEMIEGLLQEDRRLVERIACLARSRGLHDTTETHSSAERSRS